MCNIAEYFYELCHIVKSPQRISKYKRRLKFSPSDATSLCPVPLSDPLSLSPVPLSHVTSLSPLPLSDPTSFSPLPLSDPTSFSPLPLGDATFLYSPVISSPNNPTSLSSLPPLLITLNDAASLTAPFPLNNPNPPSALPPLPLVTSYQGLPLLFSRALYSPCS